MKLNSGMNYSIKTSVSVTLLAVSLSLIAGLSIQAGSPVTDVVVETKHVLEHDTLLLVCNTTVLKGIEDFFWIKNETNGKGSELFSTGNWKVEFFSIEREAAGIYICHALDNSTGENVTLTTTKVDVQFTYRAGIYICHALDNSPGVNVALTTTKVDVKYPTECERMSLGPEVITENETFSVSCSMHGNPEPNWSIYNNETGVVIFEASLSADASLAAVPVRCGYSGFWVCTGYNELNHGINATRGVHLSVRCPPRPDPESQIELNYQSSIHNNVSMKLKITGDPVPSYVWSRDDNKPFGDVIIADGPRGTTLTIEDVAVDDFGNYTLKMNNSMGSYVAHYSLHAYGYPGKPYNVRASNVTHDSVDLSWTSGYDMGTTERFMVAKFVKNTYETITDYIEGPYVDGGVGHNWSYLLTGLDSDTEYTLAVLAENAQNWTFSDKISFNTSAAPVPPPPQLHVSGLAVGVIAGGVIGGVVLLAILIGLATLVYKRRNNSTAIAKDKGPLISHMGNQYGGTYAVNKKTAF